MRANKLTTAILFSSMWLLMVQDKVEISNNIWGENRKATILGWVSTGIWFQTKKSCKDQAEKGTKKAAIIYLCKEFKPSM